MLENRVKLPWLLFNTADCKTFIYLTNRIYTEYKSDQSVWIDELISYLLNVSI